MNELMRVRSVVLAAALLVTVSGASAGGQARSQTAAGQAGEGAPRLAPFVPSPQEVVERMLELAGVTRKDIVYDLGCGDGRIVITAAKKYGARAVGIDIDPERVKEARENVRKAGVERLVTIRQEDALKANVSRATVVTLYLLNSSNLLLRPLLTKQLRPGARIVSHAFDMGDWPPLKTELVEDGEGITRTIYLWRADGKVR